MDKFYYIYFDSAQTHRFIPRATDEELTRQCNGYKEIVKMTGVGVVLYNVTFYDTLEACQQACDRINGAINKFVDAYIHSVPEAKAIFHKRICELGSTKD